MPKICYVERSFGTEAQDKINKANDLIREYRQQGYELTLRQLFYQFVSRDYIANNVREYKNLGNVIADARLAGEIDWNAIVDRTRNLDAPPSWKNPQEILSSCAEQFRLDKWVGQETRVEVWVEKDALEGIVERATRECNVAFFSCRGYSSATSLWDAGRRLMEYRNSGQRPVIIHLGDHDPSGKDMTRDIKERLEMFSEDKIEVRRIALNMDQVRRYRPPPNPAKLTDSRARAYIAEFGRQSWELDALEPRVLHDLITTTIREYCDMDLYNEREAQEAEHRRKLTAVSENWQKVSKKL